MKNPHRPVPCSHCGEPWERRRLRAELKSQTAEELLAEGWKLGGKRLVVIRCPRCPMKKDRLDDGEVRRYALGSLADLLQEE